MDIETPQRDEQQDGSLDHADLATRRRSRVYQATAIVIRRQDLGEADRLVTVLTREHGKRRLVSKGARRPSSRQGGHLEPFAVARVSIARAKTLDIVTQAETLESFPELREREAAIAAAGVCAELIDSLLLDEEAQPGVFDLLQAALDLLSHGHQPERVALIFQFRLLQELGYRPELQRCLACERPLEPGGNAFVMDGGVLCPSCAASVPGSLPIGDPALKFLRLIDRGEIERALRLQISPAVIQETERLIVEYTQRIIGRDLRARRVVRDLRLE
jgi:DNA repair protein RecO (recombination protein O)